MFTFLLPKNLSILIVCLLSATYTIAQDTTETGISISPSTIYFNAKPGGTQTKVIKIHNDTRSVKKFQISYNDYNALTEGGSAGQKVSSDYKYALSKWLSTSPTYIEIPPRETKSISVTLTVPPGDSSAISAWSMVVIDQATDRKPLDIASTTNTVAMGITQGMGFGVFVYQNPPNVANNKVDITALKYEPGTAPAANKLMMEAKNIGDGIGFCVYYVELTNLMTGKTDKLKVRQFTVLPGYDRKIGFELPKELPKAKYSAVAVLDFGSKDDLQTAELDFEIK